MREVVLRATKNIDPERDIQFTLGPIDWPEMLRMDPATKSKVDGLWSKLGL